MNVSIPQPRLRQPIWPCATVWLSAFLSPSAYFLLILLAVKFRIPAPAETLVATLFFLIPVAALIICESVAWANGKTIGRKISWMVFTLVAMLIQFGIILAILRTILVVAIAHP